MAPTMLLQTLETVRRRVRVLTVVTGVGLVLTAAVAVLVATALLDYLLNLPAFPRTLLDVAALGTLGYVVARFVVRPLVAKLTLNDVAGRVERAYPQFQDRLRSTIDIVTGRVVPGSEVMKQRVVSEATRLSNGLDLTRVVVARPAVTAVGSAGLAGVTLALILLAVGSTYSGTSLKRLLLPFAGVNWPVQVMIEQVGDVPARVTVGQRIELAVRLTKGDKPSRRATLHFTYADGTGNGGSPDQELMTRGDDGVYRASLDARTLAEAQAGTVKISVDAGPDGHIDIPAVKVVQRLSLARVDAEVTAPPYARVPAVKVNLGQTPGVATVGSVVRLTATFNKSLDPARPVTAEMVGPKPAASPIHWETPVDNAVVGTFVATETTRFRVHAVDTDGVANPAAEEFELVVKPDMNPTVVIEVPRHNQDCTPDATVGVQAVAEDDFGIQNLTLIVDRAGDKKHWELPLVVDAKEAGGVRWARVDDGGDLQRFRANYAWALASLKDANLKPGDVLNFYASVRDNYVLNGQTHPPVSSGWLKITVISQQQLDENNTAALAEIGDKITALKQTEMATARQTSTLASELKDKANLDAADKAALDRLAAQQGGAASTAKELAAKVNEVLDRMDQNKSLNLELRATAKDVRDILNDAAEHPMKDASTDLNQTQQQPSAQDRGKSMEDAKGAEAKAADKLAAALAKLGGIGSSSRAIADVADLLDKQVALEAETTALAKSTIGKKPDDLTPADRTALQKNADAQADLGKKTRDEIDRLKADAPKLAKSDPDSSKAMNDAADAGVQQDVPGNMKKASDSVKGNKQNDAQKGQKDAELGLRMMLQDLKEAQTRKLDALAKKLGELQEQVATQIRLQAGYNLDDVALQAPADRAKVDPKAIAQLMGFSKRDPAAVPPAADLSMLTPAQEQTQVNVRSIAASAEEMPDGAEIADHLTRAADKMERAIVYLRSTQLAAAYSPPMTDALEELLSAKRAVDEQKKKADAKQQGAKKEAIRQRYIAIISAQKDIDAKTVAIDNNPKADDGSLRRADRVAVENLAGDQSKLAVEVKTLDEELAGLGSLVYSYTNKDVVSNMGEVHDALAAHRPGVPTQAQQDQIVAELDAMIRDLQTKPETSDFAQHQGDSKGGDGQQQKKGLPGEAELRLLKDHQLAINARTTALAKMAAPAKPDFEAVGKRQGDLRGLLDQLIQKATKGKSKLGPEPANEPKLPEEGSLDPDKAVEMVDRQETEDFLLGQGSSPRVDKPAVKPGEPAPPPADAADPEITGVGDRMARSRQRLAINDDPGAVTREIQTRILADLDSLIEQARKKESEGQNQPPKPADDDDQKMSKPKPGDSKPQPQQTQAQAEKPAPAAGAKPATSANPHGGAGQPEGSPDLALDARSQWGNVSQRVRDAVTESKNEQVIDKYRKMVDDYYRTMGNKEPAP